MPVLRPFLLSLGRSVADKFRLNLSTVPLVNLCGHALPHSIPTSLSPSLRPSAMNSPGPTILKTGLRLKPRQTMSKPRRLRQLYQLHRLHRAHRLHHPRRLLLQFHPRRRLPSASTSNLPDLQCSKRLLPTSTRQGGRIKVMGSKESIICSRKPMKASPTKTWSCTTRLERCIRWTAWT